MGVKIQIPARNRGFGTLQLGGVRIPTTAEVRWELEDGPFTYFRGRITSFAIA